MNKNVRQYIYLEKLVHFIISMGHKKSTHTQTPDKKKKKDIYLDK